MAIKLYNTLTRRKDEFEPLHGKKVNFYSCGPTVYDYFHIGNARPLIMFDVLRRYLEYRGYEVNYIVNITDIDDKIIRKAAEENLDFRSVARKYTDAFFEGCEKLGVHPATHHPKATEHIDEMLELIKTLIEKGHAYELDGDVYFDVASFPEYGKLSGRDITQSQAGARVDVDERKKTPQDFALWKSAKPEEPSWDSPWGPGRPGWHIECSVMSMRYAGDTLDIHSGGQDLIFPHHENEIAQSEAATGKPFTRFWLHNGFLDIEGQKMSKSLGNFFTVNQILEKYDPATVRMFFLLKHYRSPIDFSEERILEARSALDRLRNAYQKIKRVMGKQPDSALSSEIPEISSISSNFEKIIEAMDDDFNTAKTMGHLFEIAGIVNSYPEDNPGSYAVMSEANMVFESFGRIVLGIEFEASLEADTMTSELVELLIEIRSRARSEKNWAMSDLIRDRLKELGIALEDRPDGTTWKAV